jgi:uncharacterized protein (TIGR00255 family)
LAPRAAFGNGRLACGGRGAGLLRLQDQYREGARWAWDIKSVNGKAFDLRLRVPVGFEALEPVARNRFATCLKRGTLHASLTVQRDAPPPTVRLNRPALDALIAALAEVGTRDFLAPPSLDGLLAVRGIVDVVETLADDAADLSLGGLVLASLDEALERLVAMREGEGQALGRLIDDRLTAIADLTEAAEATPGRRPEAVRQRLLQRVAELAGAVPPLDATRLHQEAILMAAKADVREELDRLVLHRRAAQALLAEGGPVGRRLDFLAQELSREAATLCAKSNDGALTLIGLDLRTLIDQLREQIQNLE